MEAALKVIIYLLMIGLFILISAAAIKLGGASERYDAMIKPYHDDGYKIIAKFIDNSYSMPSLESCSDKNSVIFINHKGKKIKSIDQAYLVLCQ